MELKVTDRLIEGKAFVLLNQEIDNNMSAMISEEMYWLKSQGYDITLKINSPGGSVLAGYNIIDAVITTEADTHIIGVAASMAGVIAQFGKKRIANDNAIAMIHPPQGGGNKSSKDLLEIVRKQLKNALVSRSKFKEDEVENMLRDGGEDKWYDAEQMLEMGLVDELVKTNQKVETVNKTPSELFLIYNKLNEPEKTMDLSVIKNHLGLNNAASDEKVIEAVQELANKLKDSEEMQAEALKENETLENKVKELTEQIENAQKEKVKKLIDNKIELGIIKEDNREKWEKLANNDFTLAEETLKGMEETVKMSTNDIITPTNNGVKSLKAMSVEEREELARNNPEAYNKLLLKEETN